MEPYSWQLAPIWAVVSFFIIIIVVVVVVVNGLG
jgi:hypothetical protein